MKSTVITASLCLVLGIAIGWIAKPGQPESTAVTATTPGSAMAKSAPGATPSTKIVDSPTLPSKSLRPTDDETGKKKPTFTMSGSNPAMQERFQKMIVDQAKQKSDRRIAELAEKLGLTEEQTSKLQAYFDEKLAAITDKPDDEGGFPDMLALSKLQSNKSIDTALADILTDEQSTAYEELKTNERNRKVESRAYKDLARINSVLDLNDDQKNTVYDVLYEEAGRKVDKSNDPDSAMAMIMGGHGIDIEVDDIAIGGMGGIDGMVETALDSEGNPSPMSHEDMMKNMREQNQKRIDDQVNRLAPALTPEQTEQYRKHLETKNSDMYQNMFLKEGDADSPTAVFKIETSVSE